MYVHANNPKNVCCILIYMYIYNLVSNKASHTPILPAVASTSAAVVLLLVVVDLVVRPPTFASICFLGRFYQ